MFASSAEASIPLAVDAVRRGAFDFVAKPFDGGDVVARVNAALGEISRTPGGIPTELWDQAHLTGREWEVLERIALGESAKEIAQALGLSSRTVEGYRANILRKAGVRSTTELVRRVFGRVLARCCLNNWRAARRAAPAPMTSQPISGMKAENSRLCLA